MLAVFDTIKLLNGSRIVGTVQITILSGSEWFGDDEYGEFWSGPVADVDAGFTSSFFRSDDDELYGE
jgi:hypothetical protein